MPTNWSYALLCVGRRGRRLARRLSTMLAALWHCEWGKPAYQVYSGLLFGLPLAMTGFTRLSRFTEAVGRRLTCTMVSMYFDDAHIADLGSAKGSGQHAFGEVNCLMGSPFAAEKRQVMASSDTSWA